MSEPADRASRRRLRRLRRRGWTVRWRAFGRWVVRPLVKLAAAWRAAAAYLAAASERSLTRL
ncbi:MAG: hypothetical protein ACKOBM_05505, partial [Gammaproteobacteria bacterium]